MAYTYSLKFVIKQNDALCDIGPAIPGIPHLGTRNLVNSPSIVLLSPNITLACHPRPTTESK